MKRLGVLLVLLVLGSLFTGVGSVRAADNDENYILIRTNIGEFDTSITSVAGYTIEYIDNRTAKITLNSFTDFVSLFASVSFERGNSQTKLDQILSSLRLSDGGTVSDYTLVTTFRINVTHVDRFYRYSSSRQTFTETITLSGGVGYVYPTRRWYDYAFYVDGINYAPDKLVGPLPEGTHNIEVRVYSDASFVVIYFDDTSLTYTGDFTHVASKTYNFEQVTFRVTFSLKDALTGQPLTGVTVKEGSKILGTLDDGGTLVLAKGQHTLTLEKAGYWSVTKTIDVQSDVSVSVEMYPSSAAFKFEDFPAEIKTYENTIYTLTFTLSPIETSATYNTYLSISSLSGIIEVQKDGSVISPESGKYYLGDISSPVQVSIKFKASAVGTHGFTIALTSNDAIMSKTYTTTKSVTYTVEPLPFSVQMPQEWQVGTNTLRISESSGQSYLVTVVLKDSSGNEVWSDSYAFSPYEAHTFSVDVPSEGQYTLEIQFQGKTAVYDITVNPAITLKTKTLTVEKGGEGTIILHFKNPSSDVQYYTIVVSGGFLPKAINQSISVGPLTEKDVSIAFAVPEELTYDAYELNVAVYQGNATVFQDKVAVSISEGSGFTLFGGGSGGGNTLLYLLAGLIFFGGLVVILRRKKR